MTIRFCDVSMHDRNRRGRPLDWYAIAAAGYGDICIARVTYGDPGGFNPSSPYAAEMLDGARDAGYSVRIGYHNLINGDQASIMRQVDYLRRTLDICRATSGMVDVERYPELVKNGLWPRFDDVQRFHDRWHQLDQRPLVWYIPRWLWRNHLGKPDLRGLKGPLTNSHYGIGYADDVPGWLTMGNRQPDVLQYTSSANIPGASNLTDVNAFRGTVEQFTKLVSSPDTTLPSLPNPAGSDVLGGMVL